jgi:uncharacterized damage-inducible protein DinB
MHTLKVYDYLLAARERLMAWARPLTPEQWSRQFPFGLNSVGRTLTHIAGCELWHMERMRNGGDWMPPPYEQWPLQDETPPPFSELEPIWRDIGRQTRATLVEKVDGGQWAAEFEYLSTGWDGKRSIITVSPADIFTLILVHEAHHRAQAMAMLRQMGIPAENLDPFYLMYKRREA